eukprot:3333542-Rhodomonas_salina.1
MIGMEGGPHILDGDAIDLLLALCHPDRILLTHRHAQTQSQAAASTTFLVCIHAWVNLFSHPPATVSLALLLLFHVALHREFAFSQRLSLHIKP